MDSAYRPIPNKPPRADRTRRVGFNIFATPSFRFLQNRSRWARFALALQLRTYDLRAGDHGLQLAESNLARQILHAAVRCDQQISRIDVRQRSTDTLCHPLG